MRERAGEGKSVLWGSIQIPIEFGEGVRVSRLSRGILSWTPLFTLLFTRIQTIAIKKAADLRRLSPSRLFPSLQQFPSWSERLIILVPNRNFSLSASWSKEGFGPLLL